MQGLDIGGGRGVRSQEAEAADSFRARRQTSRALSMADWRTTAPVAVVWSSRM